MDSFEIRAVTPDAISSLLAIENRCFSDPWTEAMMSGAFRYPGARVFGLFENDRLCGYCFIGSVLDEGELMNLCVDEPYRRRGFGRALLHHVFAAVRRQGVSRIYLEVRKRNGSARALYESEGFVPVGERPGYYGDDDAVVMMKKIS